MSTYKSNIINLSQIQKHSSTFRVRTTKLSNKQKQWITFKVSALEMRALRSTVNKLKEPKQIY